jgi:hypothetical protein
MSGSCTTVATPTPLNPAPLNFTKDNYYGSMLRLVLDYSASKKGQRRLDDYQSEGEPGADRCSVVGHDRHRSL